MKKKQKRTEKFNKKYGIISLEEEKKLRDKEAEEKTLPSEKEEERAPVYAVEKKTKKVEKKLSPREAVKRKRKRKIYLIFGAVLLILVAFSLINIVKVKMEERDLKKEAQELAEQKEDLEEELTLVNTPGYIEQQARTQLHLVMPGEILYILPEDQEKEEKKENREEQETPEDEN